MLTTTIPALVWSVRHALEVVETMTIASYDSGLVAHLESCLGELTDGWKASPDGHSEPVLQIASFKGGRIHGVESFATLGLHRHPLKSPSSGKSFRVELMMMVRGDGNDWVPSILGEVVESLLHNRRVVLQGEVIGPMGPIFPGSRLEALYAAMPVYCPEGFETWRGPSGDVAIIWLVPIAHSEAHFIWERGWDSFEDILARVDPDLLNMCRQPKDLRAS